MKPSPLLTLGLLILIAAFIGYWIGGGSEPVVCRTKDLIPNARTSSSWTPGVSNFQQATPRDSVAPTLVEVTAWSFQPEAQRISRSHARVRAGQGRLRLASLPLLVKMREGQRVSFDLGEEGSYEGLVNYAQATSDGRHVLAGELAGKLGGFALAQRGSGFSGHIILPATNVMYAVSADVGQSVVTKQPLDTQLCLGLPVPDNEPPAPKQAMAAVVPTVPVHDSRPSASSVIYLDFDGESLRDPIWGYGKPLDVKPAIIVTKPITSAQITEIWGRVAEDFRPFDVAVTTIRARYDQAPAQHRMRCIFTPTRHFAETPYYTTSVGGAAWRGTFALNSDAPAAAPDDTPCFVFTGSDPTRMARAASHELGHTLSLWHQGVFYQAYPGYWAYQHYSPGHGFGAGSWAPIMGMPYYKSIVQWSRTEERYGSSDYPTPYEGGSTFSATTQDDLGVMLSSGLTLAADEDGGSAFLAASVGVTGKISLQAIINRESDEDFWRFDTAGGGMNVSAAPVGVDTNLDIELELRGSDDFTVLAMSSSITSLSASLSKTLTAGSYYIVVRGAGKGDAATDGYSRYGSLGLYSLTGAYVQVPDAPVIVTQPLASLFPQGSTAALSVVVRANVPVRYQWEKQNLDGSFSPVSGKTSAVLSFSNAQYANEGNYRVVVTNTRGGPPLASITSNAVLLSINSKPLITVQPSAITSAAGSSTPASVSVTATGTPTLHYQWQKNGANVGSDSAVLVINNPQFQDGASYRCVVSNTFGSAISNAAIVTVTAAPLITVPLPPTASVPLGGTAALAITAVGSPSLMFQWFKDNVKISGATKNVLTLSGIKPTAAGIYRVEVKNSFTSVPISSTDCVVTVLNPPVITAQPLPVTVGTDSPLLLAATATGEPPLVFQWQRDNIDIPGANLPSYQVALASWADRGTYRVVVSNAVGLVTSKTAIVTVQSAPLIQTPPIANLKIARGGKGTLAVLATGSPTIGYQWQRNTGSGFVDVPGAKSATLSLAGVDANAGSYQVVVKNNYGTVTTTSSSVVVEDAPKFATHPASQTKPFGGSVTFSASLSVGASPLSYQWQRNGVNLSGPGATDPTLTIANLQQANAGSYRLIVSNNVGTATSNAAVLTMLTPPSISLDPMDLTVNAFEPASLVVAATGSPTLKYQWLKDGLAISGATGSIYKLSSAQPSHSGSYTVLISNAAANVTSAAATLTVNPVTPATLGGMYPSQGKADCLVLLNGTGLNWTQSVSMWKAGNSALPCLFRILSPTQLLITVPKTAITSKFTVVTRAGSVSSSNPYTVRTYPVNDTPADAIIVPPEAEKSMSGDNLIFTLLDPTDPPVDTNSFYPAYRSAWYRFTPAKSGVYRLSYVGYTGASYDPVDLRLGIFLGDPLTTQLTAADSVASNRFYGSRPLDATQAYYENQNQLSGYSETLSFYAATGQTYWIMVGAIAFVNFGTIYDYSGPFSFYIHLDSVQ